MVLDHRKYAIRGLWRRNNKFLARITVEDDAARKEVKWMSLQAATAAGVQVELRAVLVERKYQPPHFFWLFARNIGDTISGCKSTRLIQSETANGPASIHSLAIRAPRPVASGRDLA